MDKQRQAVRRAYELKRLRWAFKRAAVVVPLGLSALFLSAPPSQVFGATACLFVLATLLGFWRTNLGLGAVSGAWVALIPVLVGLGMKGLNGPMSQAACYAFCLTGTFGLALIAGFFLSKRALQSKKQSHQFVLAATASATVSIVVGCSTLGFGSVFGLMVGLLVSGVPVYVRGPKTITGPPPAGTL